MLSWLWTLLRFRSLSAIGGRCIGSVERGERVCVSCASRVGNALWIWDGSCCVNATRCKYKVTCTAGSGSGSGERGR